MEVKYQTRSGHLHNQREHSPSASGLSVGLRFGGEAAWGGPGQQISGGGALGAADGGRRKTAPALRAERTFRWPRLRAPREAPSTTVDGYWLFVLLTRNGGPRVVPFLAPPSQVEGKEGPEGERCAQVAACAGAEAMRKGVCAWGRGVGALGCVAVALQWGAWLTRCARLAEDAR